jgi:hypothetical protein
MELHVEGAEIQDRVHILVSLTSILSGQTIWNQRATVPVVEADFRSGPVICRRWCSRRRMPRSCIFLCCANARMGRAARMP